MSLHKPYFSISAKTAGGFEVRHNCNGGIDFAATDDIDEKTYRLINLAIEEGKRQKAQEVANALGLLK